MSTVSSNPRRSNRAIVACAVAALSMAALDLLTKSWAEDALSVERVGDRPEVCEPDEYGYIRYQRARRPGIVLVQDVLEFEYAENCGAAFGLLRNAPFPVRLGIFGPAALLATVVLFWLFVTGRGGPWFAWSVPFVVSGAIGNLVDRVRYGYVVDFIHFHWKDAFYWPTFNVADIAITVGVALLLIDGFRKGPRGSEAADPADTAAPGPAEAGVSAGAITSSSDSSDASAS